MFTMSNCDRKSLFSRKRTEQLNLRVHVTVHNLHTSFSEQNTVTFAFGVQIKF